MAKRLNKGMITTVTGICFIGFTLGGILYVGSLKEDDPSIAVQEAKAAAEAGEYKRAYALYRRAFGIEPNAEYLVRCGELLMEMSDEPKAIQEWRNALVNQPDLKEAHEKLNMTILGWARTYGNLKMWLSLYDYSNAYLEQYPQDPQALFTNGVVLIELAGLNQKEGNAAKGMAQVRRAVEIAPANVDYSATLATYLQRSGDSQGAEGLFRDLIDLNTTPGEDACNVRTFYANYCAGLGRHDEAMKWYDEAIAMSGDDDEAFISASISKARYLFAFKWSPLPVEERVGPKGEEIFNLIEKVLRTAIDRDPDGYLAFLDLAERYAGKADFQKALAVCEERLGRSFERKGLRGFRVKAARYQLLTKAAEYASYLAGPMPVDSPERADIIARAEGYADEALAEIEGAEAYHVKGMVKAVQNKQREAIALLQQADTLYPMPDWKNKQMLARLLEADGQLGAALTAIEEAVEDPAATMNCYVMYGRLLTSQGQPQKAVEVLNLVLDVLPNDETALREIIAAHQALGRLDMVEQYVTRLADLQESGPDNEAMRIKLLMARGKTDDALQRGLVAVEEFPSHTELIRVTERLLRDAGRKDEAERIVDRAINQDPDNFELKRIRLLMRDFETDDQRIDAMVKLIQEVKDPFVRAWETAKLYHLKGDLEKAMPYLNEAERLLDAKEAGAAQIANERYMRELLDLKLIAALSFDKPDMARQVVEKAIKLNIDGAGGQTFQARMFIAKNEYELAVTSYQEALKRQPANSFAWSMLGLCYLQMDRDADAEVAFHRALEANPSEPYAHKGLAMIAFQNGDAESYTEHLRACVRALPHDEWVASQAMAIQDQDSPEKGIARREQQRKLHPDDEANLMHLSDLYRKTGQNDIASERIEEFLALKPDLASAVWRAAMHYRAIDQPEMGLKKVQDFVDRADSPDTKAESRVLLSAYYQLMGNEEKTEQVLLDGAKFKLTPKLGYALSRYYAIHEQQETALEWADKTLAASPKDESPQAMDVCLLRVELLLALDRKDAALDAANRLLSDYPGEHFALFIRSEIEARKGHVDKAIESINRYLENVPNDSRGLFRRAQFYAVQTNWPAVIKDLEALKTRDPDALDYRPRILLADAYSRVNKNDLATLELENILRSKPDEEEVANQLLRLYYKSDQLDKCRQVLTSLINVYPDDPKWLGIRGEISLRMGHSADAVRDFRRGAEMSNYSPRYTRFLMDYYKDAKAYAKGIEFFEKELPDTEAARHPTIRFRYAHMLARAGNEAKAVEEYRRAAREAGTSSEAFLSIIVKDASEVLGRERSVEVFQSTPVEPENERSNRILVAFLQLGHQQIDAAIDNINGLIKNPVDDKERILLDTLLYMCHDRKRDYSAAREACEDILRIDPENPFGLNNIAYQLAENLNDADSAMEYAKRAVRAQPKNPNIIDTLGWVYVHQGNYDNAIGELNRAIGLNPNFVEARWHLGEAYRRKGEYQLAKQQFEEALALIDQGVDTHMRRKVEESLNMANAMLGGG